MIGWLTEIIFSTAFFNLFCLPVLKCFNNTNLLLSVGWLQVKLGCASGCPALQVDADIPISIFFSVPHWPSCNIGPYLAMDRLGNSFKLITLTQGTFA